MVVLYEQYGVIESVGQYAAPASPSGIAKNSLLPRSTRKQHAGSGGALGGGRSGGGEIGEGGDSGVGGDCGRLVPLSMHVGTGSHQPLTHAPTAPALGSQRVPSGSQLNSLASKAYICCVQLPSVVLAQRTMQGWSPKIGHVEVSTL